MAKTNRSDPPWKWLCLMHKRAEGFGFVTNETWDGFPPYLYCKDLNNGFCPLWKPIPTPKEKSE